MTTCDEVRRLLNIGAYDKAVQDMLVLILFAGGWT